MPAKDIGKTPGSSRRISLLLRAAPYAIAVLLGVGVYLRAVRGPFIWDDQVFIEDMKADPGRSLLSVFSSSFIGSFGGEGGNFYRPIVSLSLLLDFRLWGEQTLGYHLVNLALHALCILAVAWLAALVLQSRTAAIGAAFMFAVHPAHSQSVAWISGRTDLFCAAFLIPALCTYMVYRKSRKKPILALSLLLTLLALMSKELAVLTPVLIGLVAWGSGERSYRRIVMDAIPYLAVAGAFFLVRGMILTNPEPFPVEMPTKLRLAIIAYSLYAHFQMLILPHTARLGYLLTPEQIISQRTALYGLALAVVTVSLWSNRSWSRIPFFGMAWFILTIAPVSGVPGAYSTGMVSERFVYLPSVGLAMVFGWLLALVFANRDVAVRGIGIALGAAILILFGVLSINRSGLYASDVVFWERFVDDSPRNPAGYYNLGIAYAHEGRHEDAADNFEKTIALYPNFKEAYYWLGRTCTELGEYDEAIENLEKALEFAPGEPILEDVLKTAIRKKAESRKPTP